jgi:DNA-binding HxlR family transcriptional regulator
LLFSRKGHGIFYPEGYTYLFKVFPIFILLIVVMFVTIRFGQMDAIIPNISKKVLTEQLKEPEEDGLVERFAYKEIPPRVEYKLSEKGVAFLPILESIKAWQPLEKNFGG